VKEKLAKQVKAKQMVNKVEKLDLKLAQVKEKRQFKRTSGGSTWCPMETGR